jgi:hypothetical protein
VGIVGMELLSVVEDFDVVEDGFSGGFTGGIVFMIHVFGFQGVKKALGDGVVRVFAFTDHALLDAILLDSFVRFTAFSLNSAVYFSLAWLSYCLCYDYSMIHKLITI